MTMTRAELPDASRVKIRGKGKNAGERFQGELAVDGVYVLRSMLRVYQYHTHTDTDTDTDDTIYLVHIESR